MTVLELVGRATSSASRCLVYAEFAFYLAQPGNLAVTPAPK